MRPHTLDEMSTIILIFCRDGANKIELIEKCYLNDIEIRFPHPQWPQRFLTNSSYLLDAATRLASRIICPAA